MNSRKIKLNNDTYEPLYRDRFFVRQKFLSRRGESISETLVALLIAALALTMLAGAITTASGMVTKSREKINKYYDRNEASDGIVKRNSTEQSGTITIKDVTPSNSEMNDQSYNVYTYKNTELRSETIEAYKVK